MGMEKVIFKTKYESMFINPFLMYGPLGSAHYHFRDIRGDLNSLFHLLDKDL